MRLVDCQVDLEVVPGDGRHRETLSGAETECTKHHSKEAREKAEMKEMLKMLKDGEPVQHNFMQQILQKARDEIGLRCSFFLFFLENLRRSSALMRIKRQSDARGTWGELKLELELLKVLNTYRDVL